jgi:hypothetical protein
MPMPKIAKQPKKRISLIVLPILGVAAMAGVLYFLFAGGTKSEKAIEPATPGWEQASVALPVPAAPPMAATELLPPPETAVTAEVVVKQDPCLQAAARLDQFFSRLDSRSYMTSQQLEGGSKQHIAGLLTRLYANPPVVTRETDNLPSLLRNTAHFYRVLGKKNIFLIKEILAEESENIEATLADFHRWSLTSPDCQVKEQPISLPLADLYEYSGFFLNTLGGQSYLLRRAPRLRTLTTYYSLLVLDQANEQGLNRHGIDIRPALNSLIDELEAFHHLDGREEYLDVLQSLKIKYRQQYGG